MEDDGAVAARAPSSCSPTCTRPGVPCALVTMSWQRFVDPILAQLPAGTFARVVTGDRVERGKPHPEPYLTAAAELGVDAEDCVAIEDSNTGAKSAEAAGCTVLCVPHHVPILEGEGRVFARDPRRPRRGRSGAPGRGVRRALSRPEHVMRP